jgi:FkbM family methyltransferase
LALKLQEPESDMKLILKNIFNSIFKYQYKRQAKKKVLALSTLPSLNGVKLIDIGAAGNIEPRWKAIESHINYIGFEPDDRSRTMLLKEKNGCRSYTLYPYAIWNQNGTVKLNLCKKPQVTSIFIPNTKFIKLFPDSERYNIVKQIKVRTKRLDSLRIKNADFIKLDIQGAELGALIGSKDTLRDVLGVETEISFLSSYNKQPLFGDIASFLSAKGFEFIDFVNLCRWEREAFNSFGQCVFGDALFLKSPERLVLEEKVNNKKLSSYLSILLLYKRFDLIDKTFQYLTPSQRKKYSNFKNSIVPIKSTHQITRKIIFITDKIIRMVDSDTKNILLH